METSMEWKDIKKELLQDKNLKRAYEKTDLAHSVGKMITDARIAKKMTQQTLAQLVGTKQPSIARIEKGSYLPSLGFLQKIADAFGTQLLPPRFEFLGNEESVSRTVVCDFQRPYITYQPRKIERRRNEDYFESNRDYILGTGELAHAS